MILIAAALAEELATARELAVRLRAQPCPGVRMLRGEIRGQPVCLLGTGVGPRNAARKLEAALSTVRPSRILNLGYAGALDPSLRIGDLVLLRRAGLFGVGPEPAEPLDRLALDGTWELETDLLAQLQDAGLTARSADGLSSPFVIGDPAQKRILWQRFGAAVIDMEAGALARVSTAEAIPLTCVKAVSDEAEDAFLAPFSYEPGAGPARRAWKAALAGGRVRRHREWRRSSAAARDSLRRFLQAFFRQPDHR